MMTGDGEDPANCTEGRCLTNGQIPDNIRTLDLQPSISASLTERGESESSLLDRNAKASYPASFADQQWIDVVTFQYFTHDFLIQEGTSGPTLFWKQSSLNDQNEYFDVEIRYPGTQRDGFRRAVAQMKSCLGSVSHHSVSYPNKPK